MTYPVRIIGWLLLVCLCDGNPANNESSTYSPKGNETWIALEESLGDLIQRLLKEYLPTIMRMRSEVELTNQCSGSLTQLVFGLRGMKLWALKMLDSAAKPTPGILMGSLSAMGSYKECVAIESDGRKPFRGKYCMVEIAPTLPEKPEFVPMLNHHLITEDNSPKIPLATRLQSLNSIFYLENATLGLCIPSTCTKNDLQAIVTSVTKSLKLKTNVSRCDIKKETQFSQEQILVIAVLATLAGFVITGTTMDIILQFKNDSEKENKGKIRGMILAFSVNNTIRKLFSKSSSSVCSHLHGIHVLTILWIIMGLTYKSYNLRFISHSFILEDESNKVLFETIYSSRTAYNTLYFLSGVLTAYFAVKNNDENKFNSFLFLLQRYTRFTSIILFSLGFIILSPLFGAGPLWEESVVNGAEVCQRSWWTYILYISNWRKYDDACTYGFQYASSLFQLHVLGLVIIAILVRYLKIGVICLLTLASASIICIAVLTYEYRLYPTVTKLAEKEFQKQLFEKTSLQPYSHMGPYIIGLIVGYILARHLTALVKAVYQVIAWILATGVCLVVVYYPFHSHRRAEPVASETTVLSSIYRTGWCISIGWVVFACATGRAGFINRFLSCSVFAPLSRLCHLVLLLIEYVILIRFGLFEQTFIYSHYNMAYEVFGHACTVLLLSLIGYILVDGPLSNILQLLADNFSGKEADLKKEVKFDNQKVQLSGVVTHLRE